MNPFPETTIDEVFGCLHSDKPPVTAENMHSACVEIAAQEYLKLNEQDDDVP